MTTDFRTGNSELWQFLAATGQFNPANLLRRESRHHYGVLLVLRGYRLLRHVHCTAAVGFARGNILDSGHRLRKEIYFR